MTADVPSTIRSPAPAPSACLRAYVELFVISFVILFLELACIRWFGSTVVFLTFFTNIVLLACVLGMSAGCLAASRRFDYLGTMIPLTLLAVIVAQGTLWGYRHHRVAIGVGNNQASPQQVYFGTETPGLGSSPSTVPIEIIAGAFYALIALIFLGPGQVLGRTLRAIPDRLSAYATNIAGSLAGIVAFSLVSYARTPPAVWFALALVPLLGFLTRLVWLQALGLGVVLLLVGYEPTPDFDDDEQVSWSPYYKVVHQRETGRIATNNIGHQQMLALDRAGAGYLLPYLLNRNSGGLPRDDVLIIGAGSGNDVQAALAQGAKHVDAVEIDPRLYEVGRDGHPDHPYQDPRVAIHLEDGRSFLRTTGKKYDQIAYALVDSLVLHSGYSSLRLESFLFTEQAFRAVQRRLKPEGVFVMSNYYRQGFVVGRLVAMAERVFGTRPVVLSLPYQAKIALDQRQHGAYTLVIVGQTDGAVAAIRNRFERGEWFWMQPAPHKHEARSIFGREPPGPLDPGETGWLKFGPATVDTNRIGRLPTDDWPFLYLRSASIPAFNLRGVAIIFAVSLLILGLAAPPSTVRPNGLMFFLGAGFMLLENRGVVQLALLFGSTWIVSAIVFSAILVMVLMSNLYVIAVPPRRTHSFYVMLMASLLLNILLPADVFLALPQAARALGACTVTFLPIFFAGVIFATAFRGSARPDVDLGSNIGGVVLGGLSEYLSLVVGFNGLLVIASTFYLLAALLGARARVSFSS